MRSWRSWWRRGGGDRCDYPRTGEVAAPPSLVIGCGQTRPASTKSRVDSGSHSAVVAAAAAWGTRLQCGRVYQRPPPLLHPVTTCVGSLSTKTSQRSHRGHLVSPEIGGDEKVEETEEETGAHLSGRGGEDETEADLEGSWAEEWEEEEDAEPEIGDGGDGGGVVLGDVEWGEQALLIADEILRLHFDEDMKMFAFKVSPRGYIYVRLDKLSNQYGCPKMEEIEKFSMLYNKRLEESGESGEVPKDLAFEVSSPGAERLLKVPEDLDRFKEMPMVVYYLEENPESRESELKDGVFLLEAVEDGARQCVWKLADVRENMDPLRKGRSLSRKRKDWRLRVPFEMLKRVMLYVA